MARIYFQGESRENAIIVKREAAEELERISGGKLVIEYIE